MSRSRVDEQGYVVAIVNDWKPTLRIVLRGIVFGLGAVLVAWISPLLLITYPLMEIVSVQAAWAFATGLGFLTTTYYLVFMAGRGELIHRRDERRSESPIYEPDSVHAERDYWSEYEMTRREINRALHKHRVLVREMRDAGLDVEGISKP